jgi:hypothetical protein
MLRRLSWRSEGEADTEDRGSSLLRVRADLGERHRGDVRSQDGASRRPPDYSKLMLFAAGPTAIVASSRARQSGVVPQGISRLAFKPVSAPINICSVSTASVKPARRIFPMSDTISQGILNTASHCDIHRIAADIRLHYCVTDDATRTHYQGHLLRHDFPSRCCRPCRPRICAAMPCTARTTACLAWARQTHRASSAIA